MLSFKTLKYFLVMKTFFESIFEHPKHSYSSKLYLICRNIYERNRMDFPKISSDRNVCTILSFLFEFLKIVKVIEKTIFNRGMLD